MPFTVALFLAGTATASAKSLGERQGLAQPITAARATLVFKRAGYRTLRDLHVEPAHVAVAIALLARRSSIPVATLRIYTTTYFARREPRPRSQFLDIRYRVANVILDLDPATHPETRRALLRVYAMLGKPHRL